MRVLIDALGAPGYPRGVGHVARELAGHLAELEGIQVSIAFGPWHRTFYGPLTASDVDLIEVRGLPANRLARHVWHALRAPALARRIAADIVHYPELVPVGRASERPVVVTAHDLGEYDQPDTYGPIQLRYRRLILDRQLNLADRIVTPSRSSAERLVVHAPNLHNRISVVPHGPGVPFATEPVRPPVPIPQPFLLHVGAHQRNKNVPRLVTAYRRLTAPPDLVLAGSDHNDTAAVERATGGDRRIHRVIAATDAELAWLYTEAIGLVFPSLNEGFGAPIIEAMGFGCPVITSDRGAPRELAADAALLIDPSSESAIAGAMQQLLADHALRDRLAILGRQRAAMFSWIRTATAMVGVYEQVLATHPKAPH
jgi:glycosyltransferase involved in cell wall biosynthesis